MAFTHMVFMFSCVLANQIQVVFRTAMCQANIYVGKAIVHHMSWLFCMFAFSWLVLLDGESLKTEIMPVNSLQCFLASNRALKRPCVYLLMTEKNVDAVFCSRGLQCFYFAYSLKEF